MLAMSTRIYEENTNSIYNSIKKNKILRNKFNKTSTKSYTLKTTKHC